MSGSELEKRVVRATQYAQRGLPHPDVGLVGVSIDAWTEAGFLEPEVRKAFRDALVEAGAKLALQGVVVTTTPAARAAKDQYVRDQRAAAAASTGRGSAAGGRESAAPGAAARAGHGSGTAGGHRSSSRARGRAKEG